MKPGLTKPFSVSADEEDLVLDACRCGRIQVMDLRSERRPPVGTLIYQAKSGRCLEHVHILVSFKTRI